VKKALAPSLPGVAPDGVISMLLRGQKWAYADAAKGSQKPTLTTAEKRAAYIYPKVIRALDNATRREILAFLLGDNAKRVSFTCLKKALPGLKNASLSRHLNILQRAWLIERRVELGSPRTAEDPYYSFYNISKFGEQLLRTFGKGLIESAR